MSSHYGSPYGPYDPNAPYGRDARGCPMSDKSRVTGGLLQLLGFFIVPGIGRLYLGYSTIGATQLILWVVGIFTLVIFIGIPLIFGVAIWALIDGILILSGSVSDPDGRTLRS